MRRRPARAFLFRVTSRVLCVTLLAQTFPIPAAGERIEWVAAPDSWAPAVEQAEDPGVAPPAPPAIEDLLTDSPPDAEAAPPPLPAAPSNDRPVSSTAPEAPAAPPAAETRSLPPARAPDRSIQPALTPREMPPVPPGASPAAALTSASSFVPGWNLASVQNEPVDKNPASVFSAITGQFTRVFAYDACTPGDPWKLYDPANAAASDLTVVDQEIGFWIEMTAPAAVPNPGTLADETTIHLCPGWNLIGFPAEQARPVQTALASIAGRYSRVFGYDPSDAADPWEVFDVAVPAWANDLQVLQPGRGYWILATAETDLTIANTGAEPTVAITSPADLAVVTTLTDIAGTVTSDRLQSWTLSYRAHGEAQETVFATGNTPVVNGRLGTFDPTLLLNGGYTLELTATDFNGQSSTVSVDVTVEGQVKIGNFTLQFLDMEIPLSGLPIQVIRSYDSRDKRRGDFGVGWTLELRQGSYRNNRKPGEGWQISSGFLPCQNIQETRGHTTTIRISDREVFRFRLRLGSPAPTLGGCFAQARFELVDGPIPGSTLTILGNTEVIYQNGTDYVVDSGSLEMYEPEQVRLTTRDGRVFDLDLQQGVTRLQDLNGNTLSITPAAVTHSSGLSVAFQRDGLGRITSITDAEGESLTYGYDAAGDLVAVTDRESQTTRFSYNGNHGLLAIEDPSGRQPVRNEYDAAGRLIRHIDAFGKTIEYDHRLGDRQEVVTDRLGHTTLMEYDTRGNIVRTVDANGEETLRSFDSDDRLLSETDPLGHTTSYTYSANGDLNSVTDPAGNRTSFTYGSRGEALTSLDPANKLVQNAYDARGNLTSSTDPLGHVTRFAYNSRGNVLTRTDPEGRVTSYAYDARGNRIRETDPLGNETTSTYDQNGRRTSLTRVRTTAAGTETLTWGYEYDGLGRVTRKTDPDGNSTVTTYDFRGNVLESIDRLGRRTTHTYDAMGRLTTTSHPDGTSEQVAYDAEGRSTSTTDRAGRTTRFEYDSLGNLVRTLGPDGSSTSRAYDAAGRIVSSTDAGGNTTTFEYDAAGRQVRVRDALGQETSYAYDAMGRRTSMADARGNTTRYEYDDSGRLTRTVFPDGTSQSTTYDRLGRKTSETDLAGKVTRFEYDALGRLTAVTDALGQATRYAYDQVGNRTSQTDANGHTTSFEYDALGRMIRRTLPLGLSETMAYDAVGNITRLTDLNGATIQFAYDTAGRLITRSYPDGTSIQLTYTTTGQRATVTDPRGLTTYQYDDQDRPVGITFPGGRTLTYAYDSRGNRTSLTAGLGSTTLTTAYAYDALSRLQQVTDPQNRLYTYTYDANGNRASLTYPNGVATTYTYDALNRLTRLGTAAASGAILQSYAYTLGAAGNRTRVEEQDGTVRAYEYDDLYRLTGERVTGPSGPVRQSLFEYDPVGNRLSQTRTDGSGTASILYTYDERDRLLSESGVTYSWDANGNLVTRSAADGATYLWSFDNRLIRVSSADGKVVEHAYDADGNRVRTEVTPPTGPPVVTEYLVDPTGPLSQVVAELDGQGNLVAFYVRGDDLLSVIRPSGSRFYHADGLGSIRLLTDELGAVTDTYTFSAFGELLAHTGSDPNPYLFAGEPFDLNSGFYYNRARWMDPRVGRFVSSDPFPGSVFDPPSLHKYLYASANPVDNTDPSGLFTGGLVGAMANLSMRGALAGMAIGAVFGAVTGGILGGWEGALRGMIGGAATGALFGAIGGGLTALAIVTTRIWPLVAYTGLMTGWGIATGLRDLANPNPRYKVVGGITLIATIVGGAFAARGIGYLNTGQPYLPQYQKYANAYKAAGDVPEITGGIPDGKYIYVVRMDRSIVYYQRDGAKFPHPNLSQGQNVLTAGEIEMASGQVVWISNQSGHFQPSSLSLQIAKLILQAKGLWGPESQVTPFQP
ncbi:MAG TPA: RHS repeat-associated core domain-containing protein [Thermoanaerobaculia bacterium]